MDIPGRCGLPGGLIWGFLALRYMENGTVLNLLSSVVFCFDNGAYKVRITFISLAQNMSRVMRNPAFLYAKLKAQNS